MNIPYEKTIADLFRWKSLNRVMTLHINFLIKKQRTMNPIYANKVAQV